MPLADRIYLHAATSANPTTSPWETGDAENGFAVMAATAVAERPEFPIAGLYHVATGAPAAPDVVNLAGAVMRTANLPHTGDTPAVTLANRTNGFFEALLKTTKTLRRLPAADTSPVYVTTGDPGPLDEDPDAPPSRLAGAALTFSKQPGVLELTGLSTYTEKAVQALIDAGTEQSVISESATRALQFVASRAVAQTAGHATSSPRHAKQPSIGDVDFVITPFPPDTLAHHVLLAALGARSLVADIMPAANRGTSYGSPLSLAEELANLVRILKNPAVLVRQEVTILVVSGTESARVSAAVFQTSVR